MVLQQLTSILETEEEYCMSETTKRMLNCIVLLPHNKQLCITQKQQTINSPFQRKSNISNISKSRGEDQ